MLPHITNSQAGVNRWDPVHSNIFEVYFTLPAAIRDQFGGDEAILTQQVLSIGGLETLDKSPDKVTQKFMGTTRTYLAPKLGETSHELTIKLNLNLRNATDNFIYKLFKAWNALGYDISTGETTLKNTYVADWLKVSIANRAGDIIREVLFHDVILGQNQSFQELNYDTNEPLELEIKFYSDWADDMNV